MDNTSKFTGKSGVYAASRPGYAEELFDFLEEKRILTGGCTVADIGAGTGKFTKQLLDRGYTVYAVEPNEDMRRTADGLLGGTRGFVSVNGCDAATGLPDASADCVTAAQAFHWFDRDAFARECRRILKPGGYAVLVYNNRDTATDVIRENMDICRTYCPGFVSFSHGLDGIELEGFFRNGYETVRFENDLTYDCGTFIRRMLSASYGLRETDDGYDGFIAALTALFEKYEENGRLRIPNHTLAYFGKIG